MTEIELRNKVAACARAWLGRKESDGSHRTIIDVYNGITPLPAGYRMTYSDPWCAAFVSAVGARCGLTDTILPECSCDRMIALYRAKGRWVEKDNYTPGIGDLVMYDWQDSGSGDNTGSADHVGLVVSVDNAVFTVIEGNNSDKVAYRSINRDGRYIRGFCCPDYAGKAGSLPDEKPADEGTAEVIDHTEPAPSGTDCTVTADLPIIRYGMVGVYVKVMQVLMVGKGFNLPRYGADGEYGNETGEKLKAFQTANKLEADGICGPKTWAALLRR